MEDASVSNRKYKYKKDLLHKRNEKCTALIMALFASRKGQTD